MIREFRENDLPALQDIHLRAGYNFSFPTMTRGENWPALKTLEDSGHVIGFVGAERTAEIQCMIDPNWKSPHARMKLLLDAHFPIREVLQEAKYPSAHVWTDPQYKFFGDHLRRLGWLQEFWNCYSMRANNV